MIKIRLKKYGRKGQPCYRIVAMDSRVKRDGRSIEELGFYNPFTKEITYDDIISYLRITLKTEYITETDNNNHTK